MSYTHTNPIPGLTNGDASDAAYFAADAIDKYLPELIRNDADRDAVEAALRDLIADYANGVITPNSIGTLDGHYDESGAAQ